MTASQVAGACITVVVALYFLGSCALDIRIKYRTRCRFQRTARDAARAQQVANDKAATRRAREIAHLYNIWPDPPRGEADIPHQIRRTEEDQ
ncbi:hypothetical protein [Streptomyces goshikiensis]|uniref:hypothetical protein n=1 Tax=Streptomyces goshikiensis TaxID=1942 RepID=UPI0036594635